VVICVVVVVVFETVVVATLMIKFSEEGGSCN
jgi:hypothetical protein